MAGEYVPGSGGKDCADYPTWGQKSSRYDYIFKGQAKEEDYPEEACTPWYHGNGQIDNLQVNQNINGSGTCTFPTFQGNINVQSWKGFDIKHPNKENHRLRHICLEGPEAGVYVRGRLTGKNVIELPDYWRGLIDPETITVTLTQIKTSQDLIIDAIEWGSRIKIRSGNGTNIDCYYVVQASRIDGEPLIVEYEGETPAEYPGSKDQFSISGFDYGRKD
jgi:hypothetical protein